MNFKKNQGFTLVELIVVIAILGLLAGIGIPMYSGYVEKADKAVEVQNITMFHNAYVVACVSNELDPNAFTPGLNWSDGVFTGLSALAPRSGEETPAMKAVNEFNDYFGFPENSFTFKHHDEEDVADGIMHGVAPEGGSTGVFGTVFESLKDNETFQNAVANLNNSTFGTIGAEGLMLKVDTVTGLAAGLAEMNENFAASLASTMGSMQESLGLTDEEFQTFITGMVAKKAAQLNPDNPDAAMDDATNQILANYAVLNAAQNTGTDKAQILSNLKGGVSVSDIKAMMSKDENATTQQEGMANAAMMYAMYTAYANGLDGEEKDSALSITGDISTFANTMANQESSQYIGFQQYLNAANGDGTSQAEKDLDGYLGAMNIINQSSAGNQDAVEDLLVNGYNNTELINALQGLMK